MKNTMAKAFGMGIVIVLLVAWSVYMLTGCGGTTPTGTTTTTTVVTTTSTTGAPATTTTTTTSTTTTTQATDLIISGKVQLAGSTAGVRGGVTITVTGGATTVVTADATTGTYEVTGLENGT